MTESRELVILDQAKQMLAEARTIDVIKLVRDKAEAARGYAKAAKLGLELQNRAAEIKLRAERKAAGVLSKMKLRGGDRTSNGSRRRVSLKDLGISRDQSKRWQLAATVSESEFEKFVSAKNTLGEEITAASLLRVARAGKAHHDKKASRRAQSTAGDQHRSIRVKGLYELICESKEHINLLTQILAPLYDRSVTNSAQPHLQNGERLALGHLLGEVDKCLLQLERQVNAIRT